MKLVIITGMSGAGKTRAIHSLEDMGFYCVDNLPPILLGKFVDTCQKTDGKLTKLALSIDVRSGSMFSELDAELSRLADNDIKYETVFLDCDDKVLIWRYKESRRKHPLSEGDTLSNALKKERKILEKIKANANYVIDTTDMIVSQLNKRLKDIFVEGKKACDITINIVSFGFKYGIPTDSDLVFDLRFMPNPFYVQSLKERTGLEKEVSDYVMNSAQSREFYERLSGMLEFLIPNYQNEGKPVLIVSLGCTGGHHRSVAVSQKLYEDLTNKGFSCNILHRDINKL